MGRRRPRLLRRLAPRWTPVAAGLIVVTLVVTNPASAHFSSTGRTSATGSTGTLRAPTAVTVPATSTPTVPVSWTASTGTPSPTGYHVTRSDGVTTTAACGSSPTTLITGTSCNDTGVPNGTFTYGVTAVYRSWTAASTASGSVVVSAATKLAFTVQPSTVVSAASISPAPQVTLQTAAGVAVPIAGRSVTVAIGTNPGGGTLSGTATAITNASGVATFPGLSIDKAGTGYTLVATSPTPSPSLTQATSTAFTVTFGAAAKLAFTKSPTTSYPGAAFYDQPTVQVQDAAGNPVTNSTVTVSQALTTPAGATLTCAAKAAVAGTATFTACSVNNLGTYTLTATSPGLTPAVSTSFAVVAAPTNLAWSSESTTICNPTPLGTAFARVYKSCVFLVAAGTFTARVGFTNAAGVAQVNYGPDATIALTTPYGYTTPISLTIPHGASESSASMTYNSFFLLNTTSPLTASTSGVTSATATLQSTP